MKSSTSDGSPSSVGVKSQTGFLSPGIATGETTRFLGSTTFAITSAYWIKDPAARHSAFSIEDPPITIDYMSGLVIQLAFLALSCSALLLAQPSSPADQPATFQSKVDLVLIPVVVRDRHGHPIGKLTKDDFSLLDKGKPQTIASFSAIERPAPSRAGSKPGIAQTPAAVTHPENTAPSSDDLKRNLIYVFDDVNTTFAGIAHMREAAVRHFKTGLAGGGRAAIYTISGNPHLDFTSDPQKLEEAASQLRWRPDAGHAHGEGQCPDVSYYLAHLILVEGQAQALDALTDHTAKCAHVRPEVARTIAIGAANQRLMTGADDTRLSLTTLRRAIRDLSAIPGPRVIVLVSPGFFAQTPEATKATSELLNLAAASQIVISGLSVRGVIMAEEEQDVTGARGEGRRPPSQFSPAQLWIKYRRESARADGDVMKDLAEGTGGAFFRNNNDLTAGFERLAEPPEFSYVLGFSPSGVKADGRFHPLKVRLLHQQGFSLEARAGYWALPPGSSETIPVVLQTGYSKPNNGEDAKVLVVTKIDLATRREGKSLTFVVALFDHAGAFVTGTSGELDLHPAEPAPTLRWEFPGMKPGTYRVRIMVREPLGSATTAMSRDVTIP